MPANTPPKNPALKHGQVLRNSGRTVAAPAILSTARAADLARSALSRSLDREQALKAEKVKLQEAHAAELARARREHRDDMLRAIASERADEAKLTGIAKTRFINRVVTADRKPREVGERFDPFEHMKALLDAEHKASEGATGVTDVRKLSPQEYAEHLRKRGLQDPVLGSHLFSR